MCSRGRCQEIEDGAARCVEGKFLRVDGGSGRREWRYAGPPDGRGHSGKHVLQAYPVPARASDSLIQCIARVCQQTDRSNDDDAVALFPPVARVLRDQEIQRLTYVEAEKIETLRGDRGITIVERRRLKYHRHARGR